jgi:hypothetical protein
MMQNQTGEKESFITRDIYLAAYMAMKGIQPELRSERDYVFFALPVNENVTSFLNEYNSNRKMAEFIRSVNNIKRQVYNLKDSIRCSLPG